jgi:DNA-binding NarL/FixJ family response regulator
MPERRLKSKDERVAVKIARAIAANEAVREHLAAQTAFQKNYERLRAERIFREASHKKKSDDAVESGLNRWTERDENTLRSMIAQRASVKDIAAAVNRSTSTVYGHIAALRRRACAN